MATGNLIVKAALKNAVPSSPGGQNSRREASTSDGRWLLPQPPPGGTYSSGLLHRRQLMGQHQSALESGAGIHSLRVLHEVYHSTQHAKTLGANRVGEALPLTSDVGHLELQLSRGEPGVRCLRPKITELDLARPLLLEARSTRLLRL